MARGKKNRHAGAKRAPGVEPKSNVKSQRQPEPESSAGVPRGALLGLAALLAVSAVVAFLLLGDGGDATEEQASDASELAVPWIDPNGQDPIVGALDVNPADDSIWMSTNTGLFKIAEGSEEPEQVTGSARDR